MDVKHFFAQMCVCVCACAHAQRNIYSHTSASTQALGHNKLLLCKWIYYVEGNTFKLSFFFCLDIFFHRMFVSWMVIQLSSAAMMKALKHKCISTSTKEEKADTDSTKVEEDEHLGWQELIIPSSIWSWRSYLHRLYLLWCRLSLVATSTTN